MIKNSLKNLLITGGSGFLGANFLEHLFLESAFRGTVVNLDKLTYAGNLQNNRKIKELFPDRYHFVLGDICDQNLLEQVIKNYQVDGIIHFAAESHVDRSIEDPDAFIRSNIFGTYCLLECLKKFAGRILRFHHISTDEVFGSLENQGKFSEKSPYAPSNPYAASKAASDLLVKSYYTTYHLPLTLSNATNNFGPYQHAEKLIPVIIDSLLLGKKIPLYGTGKNVRSWLYSHDHAAAIEKIFFRGKIGEQYLIGGSQELSNLDLAREIFNLLKEERILEGSFEDAFELIQDRPGHDWRYAVDDQKIRDNLRWQEKQPFKKALKETVQWYLSNRNEMALQS